MENQKPKQNPKKKPVGPARPNPSAYAHSPAHSAILSGDPSALRRLLSSLPNPPSSVLDRRDVPHRETPLHLALRLGDLSAAAAIAAAGADASLRSSSGWSPLDDALCLHGPTLASALLHHHHRHAVLRWRRRLPRLAAALRRSSSKDFYMEVSFRFESHVIPFVGRIAPSDTYRIRKSGADVRADTSLAGFDGFRIRRSDRSFLFLGDRNPRRPSLLILDRASKRVYEAMEMEGEPSMPRSTEEEFVTQKYVCMAGVDFAEAKLVKKTNWLKQEVKERVGQYKAKLFEIHNVNFKFKTRKVVGEGFGSSSSSELELEEEDGFLVAENIELPVPARHSSFERGEAREVVVVEKGRRSVDGGGGGGGGGRWRGWEERRAAEREHTREVRAAVWLTEDFPLGVEEVVAVMDVLADEVKAVKRVREVLATKFPPGTFPVKISIPVVPTVRVVITFSKFVDLQSSEQFFTPPSSPRDLPSSPEEEEEHHHHRPGSAASVHPMTLEEEGDPFTIPSDYTWTTLAVEDERLRRSSSRKGEFKKKQSRKTCPR